MMLLLTIAWIYNLVHDVVLIDVTAVDTCKVVAITVVALGVVVDGRYFNHNIKGQLSFIIKIIEFVFILVIPFDHINVKICANLKELVQR